MKIRKSIFTKLIGSFVLYAIIMFFTLMFCFFLEAFIIAGGKTTNLQPDGVIDENGNVVNLEIAQRIGGWVEELDDNYNVIKVYGEKKTSAQAYSADEMLNLTSAYGKTEYIGFLIQPENGTKKYLCIYDRAVMKINPTIIVNDVGKYGTPNVFPIFIPLSIVEIVLISIYLKKKIKKPLDKIILGMESLKSGDGSARINIKTEAEFEKIVDTFNVMAEQLENEKKEKELLVQKKNQMLLELSHDIKTPIATIKSYANALEAGLVPDEKIKTVYRTIDIKADRVKMLSEDMFMMLKMDNPDYRLNLEKINLCEFLRQICVEYYDEIIEDGFEFIIDIPNTEIMVTIDKNLFSRVISNLLSNAKKYNKTGRNISVALSRENDEVYLMISDDGDEIDKKFVERMFNAFSRGDESRKTDGGSGLGLAISKIIVEKHGGNIRYFRKKEENVFVVGING